MGYRLFSIEQREAHMHKYLVVVEYVDNSRVHSESCRDREIADKYAAQQAQRKDTKFVFIESKRTGRIIKYVNVKVS